MQRKFQCAFVIPGALTADKTLYFTTPSDCTLIHISACCQTQDGTIQVSDDGSAITDQDTITAGTTPVEMDQDDMLNDQYPHIAAGSVVSIAIGHGSNCVDMTIVMTFVEG